MAKVSLDKDGYPRVRVGNVRKAVHTIVMERMLGRDLLPDEEVHHLNGNRMDCRPVNLELWKTRQPKGARVDDLVAYAFQLLNTYLPKALSDNAAGLVEKFSGKEVPKYWLPPEFEW